MKKLLILIQNTLTIQQNMPKLFMHIFSVTNAMNLTLEAEKIVLKP